jgi:hypothetical protein
MPQHATHTPVFRVPGVNFGIRHFDAVVIVAAVAALAPVVVRQLCLPVAAERLVPRHDACTHTHTHTHTHAHAHAHARTCTYTHIHAHSRRDVDVPHAPQITGAGTHGHSLARKL